MHGQDSARAFNLETQLPVRVQCFKELIAQLASVHEDEVAALRREAETLRTALEENRLTLLDARSDYSKLSHVCREIAFQPSFHEVHRPCHTISQVPPAMDLSATLPVKNRALSRAGVDCESKSFVKSALVGNPMDPIFSAQADFVQINPERPEWSTEAWERETRNDFDCPDCFEPSEYAQVVRTLSNEDLSRSEESSCAVPTQHPLLEGTAICSLQHAHEHHQTPPLDSVQAKHSAFERLASLTRLTQSFTSAQSSRQDNCFPGPSFIQTGGEGNDVVQSRIIPEIFTDIHVEPSPGWKLKMSRAPSALSQCRPDILLISREAAKPLPEQALKVTECALVTSEGDPNDRARELCFLLRV